jgi:fibronectin-binding autotransporter adhesin
MSAKPRILLARRRSLFRLQLLADLQYRLREFTRKTAAITAMVAVMADSVTAQISVDSAMLTSGYSQNFDSMGTSGTAALPSGWKMTAVGAGTTAGWSTATNLTAVSAQASSSTPTTGGRYNWGSSTTDRAAGFMTSGGYASPNGLLFALTNSTTTTITGLTLGFDYERYRINTAAASVTFFTSTDGATWSALTAGDSGAFATGTNAYTFSGGTVVSKSGLNISSLSIGQNQSYYLKWNFNTTGSNSQGIGLDNFTASFATAAASPAYYWVGEDGVRGGNGTWGNSGGSAWGTSDADAAGAAWDGTKTAVFNSAAATVTVSGTVSTTKGITFDTGSSGTVISGGTSIGLDGASIADNTITVGTGVTGTIATALTGSNGLTKAGTGNLVLSGSNSYSGGTTVSAGTLTGSTASLQGAITNNAVVTFDQADNGSFASNISGTGSVTKSGAGAVTLTGSNNYSGGTTVSGGTLIGTTGSLQGTITNNAAVTFDQADSGTYAGSMSGTGSLTKSGAGAVTLAGSNSYSGGTTVSGGTLIGTTGSLQGAINNNAAVTFDQATNGTYAGNMSGSGSLTKSGTGTVILSGSNSYAGGTTVSAGSLRGTTSSLQGAITNNANVAFNQDVDGTYSGNMLGSGSLSKGGSGTVTLSGNNSFAGGTTITAGTLVASGNSAFGSGTVTLTGGRLEAANGVVISNTIVASAAAGGFIISEYVEGSSNNKYIELYNGTGSTINLSEYQLSLFGNGSSTASTTFLLNAVGAGSTLAAGGTIVIANTGAGLTLPSGVTAYPTASSLTFFNGDDALALQRADGSYVDIFGRIGDDPGTAWTAGSISTLDQTLVRNASVLTGVSVNPTGTGPSGFATLGTEWTSYPQDTVSNLGSHTMNASVGSVIIGSTVSGANVTYSGGLTLNSNAELTAATGGTTTFSGNISNAGGIAKAGAGTVILSGTNSYTGATTVSAGTLVIDGNQSSATGAMTVASGATLGGSGTVGADTTFQNGSFHTPGNSPGIQTFHDAMLTYESGSNFVWELVGNTTTQAGASPWNFDQVVLTGTSPLVFNANTSLVFNGTGSDVDWSNSFWTSNRSWLVFTGANSITGTFGSIIASADAVGGDTFTSSIGAFAWRAAGGDLFLDFTANVTAVPEPASWGGSLVLLGLWAARRRPARRKLV